MKNAISLTLVFKIVLPRAFCYVKLTFRDPLRFSWRTKNRRSSGFLVKYFLDGGIICRDLPAIYQILWVSRNCYTFTTSVMGGSEGSADILVTATGGPSIWYVSRVFWGYGISYRLICTCTCAFWGVANVYFSIDFAYVLNG